MLMTVTAGNNAQPSGRFHRQMLQNPLRDRQREGARLPNAAPGVKLLQRSQKERRMAGNEGGAGTEARPLRPGVLSGVRVVELADEQAE